MGAMLSTGQSPRCAVRTTLLTLTAKQPLSAHRVPNSSMLLTTGTYIVTYRAQNTVGLWNDDSNCRGGANTYKRTVTVVDTLKPVITLKYGGSNTIVAQGSSGEYTNSNPSVDYPNANDSPYKAAWDPNHATNNPSNDNFDDPGTA